MPQYSPCCPAVHYGIGFRAMFIDPPDTPPGDGVMHEDAREHSPKSTWAAGGFIDETSAPMTRSVHFCSLCLDCGGEKRR